MKGPARWKALPALCALVALAGCYHYQEVGLDELAPAQEVRIRVSITQAEILEETLRRDNPRVIRGTVAQREGGSLYLDVPVVTELRVGRMESLRQRIELPESSIQELERRHLDRGRTALVIGGTAIVIGGIVAGLIVQSEGTVGEDVPPSDENRIPISIPLGGWR